MDIDLQKQVDELKTMLIEFYTDDPINWIKWFIVFAVLILAYIWWIPIYNKIYYRFSHERKRDIAVSRNHVILAKLVGVYRTGDSSKKMWHAKYSYTIDGEEKIYRTLFYSLSAPPRDQKLYYLENPKKLFCYGEYHWDVPKGIMFAVLMFVPWYLAIIALVVLRIPIPK